MVLDAGQVPGRLSPTPATSLSPVPTTSPVDISLPVCCSKRVLRLIEGEGNKQQLLVALDLQSDRRSWRQSLERSTQTIQGSHGLAIQHANHVSGVQRHFHTSARRASGNDNPKRIAQFCNHRGDPLVNLQPKNPERRHKIFLGVGQPVIWYISRGGSITGTLKTSRSFP